MTPRKFNAKRFAGALEKLAKRIRKGELDPLTLDMESTTEVIRAYPTLGSPYQQAYPGAKLLFVKAKFMINPTEPKKRKRKKR